MSDPAEVAEAAADGRLALANLLIAAPGYPDLDIDVELDRLAEMASTVRGEGHMAIRRVVSIREGLGGNVDDYDDPRNSYLNEVLNRRKGIPISLSIIWIEVGRLAGIEVTGVGLPGHFLVHAGGQLVDPFHGGEAIGADNAAQLVSESIGGPPRLNPEWLEPVAPAAIIARLLRNLARLADAGRPGVDGEWIAACQAAIVRSG